MLILHQRVIVVIQNLVVELAGVGAYRQSATR
jgi:hypothetical protein